MSGFRRRSPLTGAASASLLSRWTQPGLVKLVQRGTITITGATSNTATVTSVDVLNSRLRWLSSVTSDNANTDSQAYIRLALTNATTVTGTVATDPGATSSVASFELVEYFPGAIKSIQRGTIALSGGSTATINPVNTRKTEVDYLGQTSSGGVVLLTTQAYLVLTNTTTVTAVEGVGTNATVGFQVIEWF